jgi:hypothetical protein
MLDERLKEGVRRESKLCSMCAVRLGKLKWHEKERRYY